MNKPQSAKMDSFQKSKATLAEFLMPAGRALLAFQPDLIALAWLFAAAGLSVSNWHSNQNFFWISGWNLQTASVFTGLTLILAGANLLAQLNQESEGASSSYPSIELAPGLKDNIPRLAPGLIVGGYVMILPGGLLTALAGFLATLLLWLLYGNNSILWRTNKAVESSMHILVGLFIFVIGWGLGDAPIATMIPLTIPYLLILMTLSLTIVFVLDDQPQAMKMARQLIIAVCIILLSGAIILAYRLGDPLSSTASALMLPFYTIALIRGTRIDHLRSFRYSLLVMTLFTGVRYPYLFIPIIIIFYLSRFYHFHTRGVTYPTFEGPEWGKGVAESSARRS